MSIVFVHGVNVRKGPGYEAERLVTEKFLQKYLAGAVINGKKLQSAKSRFPYWGDEATKFAWNMASLPSGQIDALGTPGVEDDLRPLIAQIKDVLPDVASAKNAPLVAVAKQSLQLAVDIVSQLLIKDASDADADKIAAFVVEAQAYAETQPHPGWLTTIQSDPQFVNKLVTEVSAVPGASVINALGVFSFITNPLSAVTAKFKSAVSAASTSVLDKVGDFASTKLLAWGRKPLNGIIGCFFGDVFIYLDSRGDKSKPGKIPTLILDEFQQSVDANPSGEPLVIIGHSLGGVVSFDLLSYFRPALEVDLFVTVGSQVSHFEEIKRFKVSDSNTPSATEPKAKTPPNIKNWINVFDEIDIFAYACEKVFDRVHDFRYDTQTYTIKAHSVYFQQDRFYRRLRARIDQLP